MNQSQLNHDQAQLTLDRFHQVARVDALVHRRRGQAEGGSSSVLAAFVLRVSTLSRRALHLGSA